MSPRKGSASETWSHHSRRIQEQPRDVWPLGKASSRFQGQHLWLLVNYTPGIWRSTHVFSQPAQCSWARSHSFTHPLPLPLSTLNSSHLQLSPWQVLVADLVVWAKSALLEGSEVLVTCPFHTVQMRELDNKEGWMWKNWCFQTVVLEKTLESPLDCKDIKLVSPKGNQPWIFIGRTDAEAEVPILWPPDAKNWLTGKDLDAGKDWRLEEKGETEDEMLGWHHQLSGHEFEQILRDNAGQGSLACCSPWGCRVGCNLVTEQQQTYKRVPPSFWLSKSIAPAVLWFLSSPAEPWAQGVQGILVA